VETRLAGAAGAGIASPLIRTGPAGWSYPDSRGHVYPADVPSKFDALAFLAGYFDTIEVNATFYRPQPRKTYASWARRVAPNASFRFAVKLWQRFTHERTGPWTADDVRMVTEGLETLAEAGRLGALLAQFPWSFKPGEEARSWLRALAGAFAGWPVVVEVRHGDWAKPEHLAFLRDLGVGFANIDQPVIGRSLEPSTEATSAVGYVRFHGRNYEHWFGENETSAQRYDYLYSAEELTPWVERIRALQAAPGVADVYVVTNNHFEGKGPANALMIRAMLDGRSVRAPATLYETYPAQLAPFASADAQTHGRTDAQTHGRTDAQADTRTRGRADAPAHRRADPRLGDL
jgi:uncharacterized protein YecE (DUF72 family)